MKILNIKVGFGLDVEDVVICLSPLVVVIIDRMF